MRNKYFSFAISFLISAAFLGIAIHGAQAQGVEIPQVGGQSSSFLGITNLSVKGVILRLISLALQLAGFISILFIIYGGYTYLTAGGNEDAAETAKRILTNAIIGFVIIILSYVILVVVQDAVTVGV